MKEFPLEDVQECSREQPHDGPCNGWPCAHVRSIMLEQMHDKSKPRRGGLKQDSGREALSRIQALEKRVETLEKLLIMYKAYKE